MVVLQRYKELFEYEVHDSIFTQSTTSATNTSISTTTNTDLLSEFLGDTITTAAQDRNPTMTSDRTKANDTLDELSDIFGSINDKAEINKPHHPSDLLNNLDLLEPISVYDSILKNNSTRTSSSIPTTNGKEEKKHQGFKELKEIDKLSEEMFKQSLKEEQRLQSFKKYVFI